MCIVTRGGKCTTVTYISIIIIIVSLDAFGFELRKSNTEVVMGRAPTPGEKDQGWSTFGKLPSREERLPKKASSGGALARLKVMMHFWEAANHLP